VNLPREPEQCRRVAVADFTCPSLQNYRPSGVVGPRRCASFATYRPGYGSAVLYLRQAKAHTAPGEDLHDDTTISHSDRPPYIPGCHQVRAPAMGRISSMEWATDKTEARTFSLIGLNRN
jgi:hypothetical protein